MVGDLSLLAASPVLLSPAKDLHGGVLPFQPKTRPPTQQLSAQQRLLEGAYQAPVHHMMMPGLGQASSPAAAAAAYQAFDMAALIDVQGSPIPLRMIKLLVISCEFDACVWMHMSRLIVGCCSGQLVRAETASTLLY